MRAVGSLRYTADADADGVWRWQCVLCGTAGGDPEPTLARRGAADHLERAHPEPPAG